MLCVIKAHGSVHGSQSKEPFSTVMDKHIKELKRHYPKGCLPPAGYVAWHDWAEAQTLHGLTQEQCDCCKLWYFPQEGFAHKPAGSDK